MSAPAPNPIGGPGTKRRMRLLLPALLMLVAGATAAVIALNRLDEDPLDLTAPPSPAARHTAGTDPAAALAVWPDGVLDTADDVATSGIYYKRAANGLLLVDIEVGVARHPEL